MERDKPSRRRFLDAAFGRPVDRPPVWLMRQAGRYLPEYRAVREKIGFLDLTENVERAVEVTLQPFRRFGMDGVVFFSDILTPFPGLGLELKLEEGGPWIGNPVRTRADVDRLRRFDPHRDTPFVPEIHRALARELGETAATIGFAGAPFTLASYAVEGSGSKSFVRTKTLMRREPAVFAALLDRLADTAADHLTAQIEAGASAVQLFDTWAGELGRGDWERFAAPALRRLLERLPRRGAVPVVYFASGSAHLVDALATLPVDVLSIDAKLPLSEARRRAPRKALQGNVDPSILLGSPADVREAALEARREAGPLGHVLNLGHGILPPTDPACVGAFVEAARAPLSDPVT